MAATKQSELLSLLRQWNYNRITAAPVFPLLDKLRCGEVIIYPVFESVNDELNTDTPPTTNVNKSAYILACRHSVGKIILQNIFLGCRQCAQICPNWYKPGMCHTNSLFLVNRLYLHGEHLLLLLPRLMVEADSHLMSIRTFQSALWHPASRILSVVTSLHCNDMKGCQPRRLRL